MILKLKSILLKKSSKIIFLATGIASLTWFLVRVIPKPSRAAYPCMKAAMPMASSLVMYLIGITSFTLLMRKAKDRYRRSKYLISVGLVLAGLLVGFTSMLSYNIRLNAHPLTASLSPNEVMGEGVGIFPGRVVWQYNPDATEQSCTNTFGDFWFDATDQSVVSDMLSEGLRTMTGAENDGVAWDSIFTYFNRRTGRGDKGYTGGEIIVVKTNNNATSRGNNAINTSPQVTYALLHQLVNEAGVAQGDIFIGDPNCAMPGYTYDLCKNDFPDVHYWGKNTSVTKVDNVLMLSDGSANDPLPKAYLDADYMINVPVLKKHHRAGISIAAKNHFGSVAPFTGGAWHLHPSLPCPEASGIAENGEYGAYRCFVDLMGHKDLGGKTLFYLVDGLWGSTNWGHPPVKFRMAPFNNDWPSSLFLSQDPVAIECVCFDFLYEEFDEDHPTEGGTPTDDKGPFPHFAGADDYLQQAADPAKRPFAYDPEDDGTVLGSLGVFEHWNNAADKKYSRDLGLNSGIELKRSDATNVPENFYIPGYGNDKLTNYPNPFTLETRIEYSLQDPGQVQVDIWSANGQKVFSYEVYHTVKGQYEFLWDGKNDKGHRLPQGTYLLTLKKTVNGQHQLQNLKMVLAD